MIENFLVFRQLLIDKKKHSRKEGIHIIVFKVQSHYRGWIKALSLTVFLTAFTQVHFPLVLLMTVVRWEPKTETYKS